MYIHIMNSALNSKTAFLIEFVICTYHEFWIK